ncbi:MAG: serine/threonine protein kinase [Deltaproteobacteria bacterium]|nr:serine/threonine protein kinase [Deltaproteobacteria bacterium]
MPSDCLDANAVQDLMSDSLDPAARADAFRHLDACADCREVIGVLAREQVQTSAEEAHRRQQATVRSAPTGLSSTAIALPDLPGPSGASLQMAKIEEQARLGRYQLIGKLGSGAMGVVYRASDIDLDRDVALKLLKRPDASLTDRLVREARAMAKVSHPNVVGVFDVGIVDGKTYIAMELVEGQSLRTWQTGTKRTIPEIIEAYVAAGRGLAAAHAAGIIHRDFKPDNALVSADGRIRVTDFGLAAAAVTTTGAKGGDAITDVDLTASGSVLGTPAYMAPEQFTGGNIDPRTDQFNYCVALYEALYGHRPFPGKTFEELGDSVCDGKVRPPNGANVSAALRKILLRGLSVRPGDRFPTMDALLVELGRDRARPWRWAALASTGIAIALGLGVVADWAVRDRVERQIHDAFQVTGQQVDNTVDLLQRKFVVASNVAYLQPQIKDVSSHYDASDFGLGNAEDDRNLLVELREILRSADWESWTRDIGSSRLAIADRNGRLLYTSMNPDVWDIDLTGLPIMKRLLALERDQPTSQVLRADAEVFTRSKMLGAGVTGGLWMMFARGLVTQKKLGAVYMQFSPADELLRGIRRDEETTLLALAAPDGTYVSPNDEMPRSLVEETLAEHAASGGERLIHDVRAGGVPYQVQVVAIYDSPADSADAKEPRTPIANVVMARRLASTLSGLFPGARIVFLALAAVALALALATADRARRLTGGARDPRPERAPRSDGRASSGPRG